MLHLVADFGRRWRDILRLTGAGIKPGKVAARAAGINNLRIHRVRQNVTTLVRADRMPVAKCYLAVVTAADDAADPLSCCAP